MSSLDDSMHAPKFMRGDAPNHVAPSAHLALPTPSPVQSLPSRQPLRLGDVTPVDPRGRHELLRLAAGLAPLLHSPTGDAIVEATGGLGIEPARVERVVTSLRDSGVIALVDGVLYALGKRSFLEDIGIRPHMAETRVAERIERSGGVPYFVVAVARANCLGVFGAPNLFLPSDTAADR